MLIFKCSCTNRANVTKINILIVPQAPDVRGLLKAHRQQPFVQAALDGRQARHTRSHDAHPFGHLHVQQSLVTSIFLYACESWTLTAELQRRIQVMEMRCYLKILHIAYEDHVTNEQVRAKIQQAIGPHEDLLTIVKRRKLQWYGHVSRSSGLAKTILQGTVKGGRRQGGQRKRWEDNIREWTGLEFGKSQRAVENREKWRKLVAKSSVVPQRPSRLRD